MKAVWDCDVKAWRQWLDYASEKKKFIRRRATGVKIKE